MVKPSREKGMALPVNAPREGLAMLTRPASE